MAPVLAPVLQAAAHSLRSREPRAERASEGGPCRVCGAELAGTSKEGVGQGPHVQGTRRRTKNGGRCSWGPAVAGLREGRRRFRPRWREGSPEPRGSRQGQEGSPDCSRPRRCRGCRGSSGTAERPAGQRRGGFQQRLRVLSLQAAAQAPKEGEEEDGRDGLRGLLLPRPGRPAHLPRGHDDEPDDGHVHDDELPAGNDGHGCPDDDADAHDARGDENEEGRQGQAREARGQAQEGSGQGRESRGPQGQGRCTRGRQYFWRWRRWWWHQQGDDRR
mmetsp:Transcript_64625/g.192537  ORF Transcript_64625/g.192537 Transcript_64625/m.192537 type:complete len:275 (-) Transcript_64625:91-915(-)